MSTEAEPEIPFMLAEIAGLTRRLLASPNHAGDPAWQRRVFINQMRSALRAADRGDVSAVFKEIAEMFDIGESALVEACEPRANGKHDDRQDRLRQEFAGRVARGEPKRDAYLAARPAAGIETPITPDSASVFASRLMNDPVVQQQINGMHGNGHHVDREQEPANGSGTFREAHDRADAEREQEQSTRANGHGANANNNLMIGTAANLRAKTFDPLKYVVPGLITEGLWVLGGRPKVKKSWFALDVGITVAADRYCLGDRKPETGYVLYIALEDGERRLQRRIDKLLGAFDCEWPEKFEYATQWPRADQGGVEQLDKWCASHPDARLVVIDVLAKFRAPSNGKTNAYQEDYAAIAKLQELATKHGIAILVIHHTRKGAGEDPVDELSGTLGIGGAADGFLVLKKANPGGTLIGRGRDIEDIELALSFNGETCRWTITGSASETKVSDERARVLNVLAKASEGMTAAEIVSVAQLGGMHAGHVLLWKMSTDGQIERVKRGVYGLPGTRSKLSRTSPHHRDHQSKSDVANSDKPLTSKVSGGRHHRHHQVTEESDLTVKAVRAKVIDFPDEVVRSEQNQLSDQDDTNITDEIPDR